jgi:hypothetical protein
MTISVLEEQDLTVLKYTECKTNQITALLHTITVLIHSEVVCAHTQRYRQLNPSVITLGQVSGTNVT